MFAGEKINRMTNRKQRITGKKSGNRAARREVRR
jgi:hypothetical protein